MLSLDSMHSRKLLLLSNNKQEPINIEESGDVMKLFFKYDVLQELNTIHMNESEVNVV